MQFDDNIYDGVEFSLQEWNHFFAIQKSLSVDQRACLIGRSEKMKATQSTAPNKHCAIGLTKRYTRIRNCFSLAFADRVRRICVMWVCVCVMQRNIPFLVKSVSVMKSHVFAYNVGNALLIVTAQCRLYFLVLLLHCDRTIQHYRYICLPSPQFGCSSNNENHACDDRQFRDVLTHQIHMKQQQQPVALATFFQSRWRRIMHRPIRIYKLFKMIIRVRTGLQIRSSNSSSNKNMYNATTTKIRRREKHKRVNNRNWAHFTDAYRLAFGITFIVRARSLCKMSMRSQWLLLEDTCETLYAPPMRCDTGKWYWPHIAGVYTRHTGKPLLFARD